ncbi:Solute carrier 25 [Perkinsus olseni]|uniref:Solute carrier 25 n=1 Tax=Perkinsus olseni TaxID=32597 RepID=A0A7J6PER7_PEROL|nr:Solute carrier 25 [Perkinsus olseni]
MTTLPIDDETWMATKAFLSGGLGACISKTCTAPLSRTTILMQVQSMRPHKFYVQGSPNNTRLLESIAKMITEEGFFSMWKGNGASCLHRFPYAGITFLVQDRVKSFFPLNWRFADLASGATAGACACLTCYPLDVVKARLATQTKTAHYQGIGHCLVLIKKEEGLRSILPRCRTHTVFGTVKSLYKKYTGEDDLPPMLAITSGCLSGFTSSSLCFPIDLVRRQMQMDGLHGRPKRFATAWHCFKHIIGTDGIRGLYRGIVPELCKVVPYVGLMFGSVEGLRNARWPHEVCDEC